ncbi:MAG: V-type ATP synthase subunit B, partial [Sphaerochaetaceae bacterium]|nr:V-type ATP synthase subunit B [Sphaerochaetaceae bacterium]
MKTDHIIGSPIDRQLLSGREYVGADRIDGPLVFMRNTHPIGYGELVQCIDTKNEVRTGQVLDTADDVVVVQLFEGTAGLTLPGTRMRFMGEPLTLDVSEQMLGRVMNGLGNPRDGAIAPKGDGERDVNGLPVNPTSREYPRDFIQTGISVIDGLTTLIQGQKLPIFSGNGLPHNQLAAQIARQAKVRGGIQDFAIVFAAMGVKYDVARFFIDSFE